MLASATEGEECLQRCFPTPLTRRRRVAFPKPSFRKEATLLAYLPFQCRLLSGMVEWLSLVFLIVLFAWHISLAVCLEV